MPIVIIIMFCCGMILGSLWKSGLTSVVIVSLSIAVGFAFYLGDWSNIHWSFSWLLRNSISLAITWIGYFGMFVVPMIGGTALGYGVNRNRRKRAC